jgi:hypothetical protein
MNERHLRPTPLLDYEHPSLQRLVEERGWRALPESERIGAIYTYVRDELRFGYNETDDLPASRVLADGYGQCNTKTTLLMALLRASGIACRLHGATIHKRLQKGVVNGLFYALAPANILHSWAEVALSGRWVALEGVILDAPYLTGLRASLPRGQGEGAFLGFAVGTENLAAPPIEWRGSDTFIQKTGVNQDFGVFEDPDAFYAAHGANLSGVKGWLFRHWMRHVMNANVTRIRGRGAGVVRAPGSRGPLALAPPPGG